MEQMLRASRSSKLDISTLSSHTKYNPSPYVALCIQYTVYAVVHSVNVNIISTINFHYKKVCFLLLEILMKYLNSPLFHQGPPPLPPYPAQVLMHPCEPSHLSSHISALRSRGSPRTSLSLHGTVQILIGRSELNTVSV